MVIRLGYSLISRDHVPETQCTCKPVDHHKHFICLFNVANADKTQLF